MKIRHVVTAVLTHGDQALVVRRSAAVATYRGLWAGISGSIEDGKTPLDQAYAEIDQETGLGRSELRLLRESTPIEVVDAALETRWVVHPFRFEVADPSRVRLDWEHTESRWVRRTEVSDLETVPRLADVFASAWSPDDAGDE